MVPLPRGNQPATTARGASEKCLEQEPRLNLRVTYIRNKISIAAALSAIGPHVKMKFLAEGDEIARRVVSFNYKQVRLRDLLDSIGSIHDWQWTRRDKDTFVLHLPPPKLETLTQLRPHTDADAEINKNGREFVRGLLALPEETQRAIRDSDKGVEFNRLPSAMQDNVRAMLRATEGTLAEAGETCPVSQAGITDGRIMMANADHRAGYSTYSIDLPFRVNDKITSSYQIGFRVFDNDPDGQDAVVPAPDLYASWFTPPPGVMDRATALQRDPRLTKHVSLVMKGATLAEALHQLAETTDFGFVIESGPAKRMERTFELRDVPLGKLLDNILSLYVVPVPPHIVQPFRTQQLTWGERPSGLFTFFLAKPVAPGREMRRDP